MFQSNLRGPATRLRRYPASGPTPAAARAWSLGLLGSILPGLALACSCGCGVFDIGTGSMFPAHSGGMVFAEYDFMDQSRNWSGTSRAPADNNGDKEIRTSFVTLGGQYLFNRSWGVTVEVPYWERYFRTADEESGDIGSFSHGALGDIRLKGIYTGFSPDMSTGLTFGLKVPTGDSTYANFDPDTEIGSGSTDLLIGGYHLGRIGASGEWNWFVEAQWQQPVAHKDSYRPGLEVDAVAGVYYGGWSFGTSGKVAPVLQLKGVYRDHDGGPLGDPDNSGYKRLLLTPGVQVDVGQVSVYVDLGIPVYTNTTGNQLVAPVLWKVNVGYHF